MYSFEGDFRRKPQQSLRGASKKVNNYRDFFSRNLQVLALKKCLIVFAYHLGVGMAQGFCPKIRDTYLLCRFQVHVSSLAKYISEKKKSTSNNPKIARTTWHLANAVLGIHYLTIDRESPDILVSKTLSRYKNLKPDEEKFLWCFSASHHFFSFPQKDRLAECLQRLLDEFS